MSSTPVVSANPLYEVPAGGTILLIGPPGVGKSTFCQQAALYNLSMDRPVLYMTAESGSREAETALRELGLGTLKPGLLSFIDAFSETVGASVPDRPDIFHANCNDLSSIDIAIARASERAGSGSVLLILDSLTTPYLFSGQGVLRFVRQTLGKFSAGGNAVLACIAEGSGKNEDLVAMMSQFNGIMRMEMEDGGRVLNVIKHSSIEPGKTPVAGRSNGIAQIEFNKDPAVVIRNMESMRYIFRSLNGKYTARKTTGDWVDILWYQLVFWSGLRWDPERFPPLLYRMAKSNIEDLKYAVYMLPWYVRPIVRALVPWIGRLFFRKGPTVKTLKRLWRHLDSSNVQEGHYTTEYLPEISRDDEHHLRKRESAGTWGFPDVGARVCFHEAAEFAGGLMLFDRGRRDWNGVEYMCIGKGDPYCQIKLIPGPSRELDEFLGSFDSEQIEKINGHIMERVTSLMLHGEGLPKRPNLREEIHIHELQGDTSWQAMHSDRYQAVLRMAGADSGRKMGQVLLDNGLGEAQAAKRLVDLFRLTKAGSLTVADTITIEDNWESFSLHMGQPFCFFTTGLLNGFFSMIKQRHVKETRCIAAGDPLCEWEFK